MEAKSDRDPYEGFILRVHRVLCGGEPDGGALHRRCALLAIAWTPASENRAM
jgi:hypothetical protein